MPATALALNGLHDAHTTILASLPQVDRGIHTALSLWLTLESEQPPRRSRLRWKQTNLGSTDKSSCCCPNLTLIFSSFQPAATAHGLCWKGKVASQLRGCQVRGLAFHLSAGDEDENAAARAGLLNADTCILFLDHRLIALASCSPLVRPGGASECR